MKKNGGGGGQKISDQKIGDLLHDPRWVDGVELSKSLLRQEEVLVPRMGNIALFFLNKKIPI